MLIGEMPNYVLICWALLLRRLSSVDLAGGLSHQHKLAFWINVYKWLHDEGNSSSPPISVSVSNSQHNQRYKNSILHGHINALLEITLRADLVTGDPEGKKSSYYSKLNCEGIPPQWIP
jgi:hypothetical protein